MTDAKGPYFVTEETEDELGSRWFIVRGPLIENSKATATTDREDALISARILNVAYAAGRASRDGLKKALESISRNTCCEPCQQAKLVALAAMKSEDDTILRRPGVA
jgi:hypothetical protein